MKKICIFLAFLAFLSAFSACSSSIQNTSTVTTGDDALELIDVQKDKEDNTIVYIDSWQILNEYDAFREYFFGVWHEADSGFAEKIIIDDSEMDFLVNNHVFYFNNFYKVNDTTFAFDIQGSADRMLFWIDTDEPNNMYYTSLAENWLYAFDNTKKVGLYEKADIQPNMPKNGFCSVYCLREIARNYGINFDMLVDVEYQVTPNSDRLLHDAKYQFYPVYLVEKTAEKLIIKTKLGNVGVAAKEVDVSIILEKTNGEWIRTIKVAD